MFQGLYGKINPYALDYPICTEKKHKHGHDLDQTEETDITGRGLDDGADTASSQVVKLMNSSSAGGPPFLPTEDVYRPCSEVHLNAYLNREDVREALHVSPSAPKKWKECSDVVKYSEEDFSATIIQLYEDVVTKAKEHNIDIFVFSGDDDSVCSTAGTVSLDLLCRRLQQSTDRYTILFSKSLSLTRVHLTFRSLFGLL